MKKIAVLLAAVMCICAMAVSVSAKSSNGSYGNVPTYKGTITVDGVVDEIYKKGLAVDIAGDFDGLPSDSTATAYFLHDGTYIYMAMEVNSAYALDTYSEANAVVDTCHKQTSVELYFDFNDDGGNNDCKYVCWYDGRYWAGKGNNVGDVLKEYKATANADAKTYVIEAKIALAQNAKVGSSIGWCAMVNANAQANIAVPTVNDKINVANTPSVFYSFTLDTAEVTDKVEAPETNDALVAVLALAAVAGTALVIFKKH